MKNINVKLLPEKATAGDIAIVKNNEAGGCIVYIYGIIKGQGTWIEHSRHFMSIDKLKTLLSNGQLDLLAKKEIKN